MPQSRRTLAGWVCVAFGVAFAWGASTYEVGTAAQMGPGYVPLMLGVLLAGLGLVMVVQGQRDAAQAPWGSGPWRPLFAILLANGFFGLALGGVPALGIPPLGLVVATLGLVALASQAPVRSRERSSLREVAVLAVLLALGAAGLFVGALGLPLPMWPVIGVAPR